MAGRNFLTLMASSIATGFKSVVPVTSLPAAMVGPGSWFGNIRESFSGAWQSNVVIDPHHTLLAFSAIYACITLIADDVSKLRIKLVEFKQGVWQETMNSAFSPVLRKPNHYQTRIQFLSQWIQSKLTYGNTYVLKERDARGIVVALYVLDPRLVKPLVTEIGDVYYQVGRDRITGEQSSTTIPASEIIHDRAICFYHPLIGIGPMYACAVSATQGARIQQNSAKFFENMSRPSGMLTAPDTISDETAARLKAEFESNFGGSNIGRLLVAGDNLKYEPMTMPAQQSQLIEQLRFTIEDVCRVFHVPLHKVASDTGVKYANMAEMNQDYYSQTLQNLIECIEVLLDEGLGLTGGPQALGVELDLEGLLRMDPMQRAQRNQIALDSGEWSPDEARATNNMPPVTGGGQPFMQMQKVPLSVLVKQFADGFPANAKPAPVAPALPAPADPAADPNAKAVTEAVTAWRAAADMVDAAEAQRVLREQEADRRRADDTAILARALDQIETERKALAAEAEADRVAKAAQEEQAQAEVEDLAALLIAKFTAATNVG